MAPNKKQFTLSFIVGVVLLPVSAIAAVALVGGDDPAPEVAIVESTTVAPTSTVAVVAAPTGLSERDIWQACVPDATALIEKEVSDSITELERAALDSLRAICAQEGMPLSGPPAPDAIVRTVRVNAPAPAVAAVTTTAAPASEDLGDDEGVAGSSSDDESDDAYDDDTYDDDTYDDDTYDDEDDDAYDDDDEEDVEDPYAGQSQYLTAHAGALAAIDAAVAAGGNAEKIDEARKQLAEGEAKAANMDFWSALEKAMEATEKADEAIRDSEDD